MPMPFPRLRRYLRRLRGMPVLVRDEVAAQYLRGDGIEIGGLNNPLLVSRQARVRYVDRMSLSDLRQHYPELKKVAIVSPDIIDNGETLATLPNDSTDFIVANHFLEHCQNPIGTLQRFLEVVRPGGYLFLAVPDKRLTFDVGRPLTTWDHLLADYADGGRSSRRSHYEEWVELVSPTSNVDELDSADYSIHFHVWNNRTFFDFLTSLQRHCHLPFEVIVYLTHSVEIVTLLRRLEPAEIIEGKR